MCGTVKHKRGLMTAAVRVALCVAFLFAPLALALDPQWKLTQYGHDIWLRQNGLPDSVINFVYPSRNGYIWLATRAGLVRFDGARFKAIEIRPNSDRVKESVMTLLETPDGALYVGTEYNGLRLIEGDRIRSFGKPDGVDNCIRVLNLS